MRDLLHGSLQTDVGAINEVQMMSRGFYYIEFANQETRDKVLASNPLNLRGAQAFCSPWQHSFNTEKEADKMDKISKISIILPGLPKEYIPFLPRIGTSLGLTLETEDSLGARIARFNGLPSIRVLVQDVSNLPNFIMLPKPGGGKFRQVVDYLGLPNQFFVYKKVGHLARDCPNKVYGKESTPQGPVRTKQEWKTVQKGKKKIHSELSDRGKIPLDNAFEILANLPTMEQGFTSGSSREQVENDLSSQKQQFVDKNELVNLSVGGIS